MDKFSNIEKLNSVLEFLKAYGYETKDLTMGQAIEIKLEIEKTLKKFENLTLVTC